MKKIIKYSSILLMGLIMFTSCSKQKYTASFAPSKQVKYVKPKAPTFAIEKDEKQDVVASATPEVKPLITLEKTENKSPEFKEVKTVSFSKSELKSTKKEVRKILFKQAKHNLFHKKSNVKSNDSKIVSIILSILIPPLGVWHYQQGITNDFWLDLVLLLTVFGSVLYALLVVFDVVSIA